MNSSPAVSRFEFFSELFESYDALARQSVENCNPREKADGTVVTQLDLAAGKMFEDALRHAFPHIGIISEEEGKDYLPGAASHWVLDPVDGTAAFSRGFPTWGVGAGLMENGRVTEGYLRFPVLNETLMAAQGEFRYNGNSYEPRDNADLTDTRNVLIGSTVFQCLRVERIRGYKLRNFGSALYHLACLVLGRTDAVISQGGYLWDIVPAMAMIASQNMEARYFDGSGFSAADFSDPRGSLEAPIIVGSSEHVANLLDQLGGAESARR